MTSKTKIEVKEEKKVDPRNKLNDLTAPEWITRTVSVFEQRGLGKNSKEARIERQHPAPFSFQDVIRFVEFFTKSGQTVLDPFCGVGSSLKAAILSGRNGVGIELNPTFAELIRERMSTEIDVALFENANYELLQGDVRDKLDELKEGSIDLVLTSPPYWGILNKVDHKAKQERLENGLTHNYGENEKDLAMIEEYDDFIGTLGGILNDMARVLASRKYMVVIVGDFRIKDRYVMFHSDLANEIERRQEFSLKGVSIIYQKFKRVFPYGYPYSFVPNIHHQYAMIFQKKE